MLPVSTAATMETIEEMLQRDYILRLIREFMAALQRVLEKDEVETKREQLKILYDKYVGPYAFYFSADIDHVITALSGRDDNDRLCRMEMLAELYLAEADTVGQPDRDFLLEKAYSLFILVDREGKTYSIDRMNKINIIKKLKLSPK